ncbi:hypothetical protein AVEN_145598-1 [Araneus ventricosus]|uniref:Endonuclease/exonuclease/phosphatase domain-containing protein n=1 Tax=Araneus ventricosus TaxID=182803 RepID=A0A4Y2DTW3_ARAVE|nr:hypothetical protein AVEN_145598-1 [Araneus ventricosus]
MATFISWNCRGFMNKSSELKDIINKHNPACIALQETYLKTDKHYLRNYEIFSKHHIQDRASGGVALLAASHIPSMSLNLNTTLQAVAIRIQIQSLVTVCSLYLPPSARISQTDLNNLISQLPSPFIILGDLNGHSPFLGQCRFQLSWPSNRTASCRPQLMPIEFRSKDTFPLTNPHLSLSRPRNFFSIPFTFFESDC